ncbi:sugar kinase [Nakamurella flavida]|uniref:Sugar kinase n=1 Tax=Nakamurella flavida TaxID=363630 RepID=A0A939C4G7_9ACTN|nr:PfkB family carbohydrate kinase [Nakamurella flavida]MBM9478081.1 sugar kinase [Nakamurella flavida]MDP9778698.1 sugar/nucleoside kinase (ribokinase family) [Nakamurella flavida]
MQPAEPGSPGSPGALPASPVPAEPIDLLFTGSVFCDVVFADVELPEPGTEVYARGFVVSPGGVANRAVAAARLGAHTVLRAHLGDDPMGTVIGTMLAAEPGLDTRFLAHHPGWQTPVSVALTNAHDRSFITYEEPAPLLTWPSDGPSVGALNVYLRGVADWTRALRRRGSLVFAGVGWDRTGEWSVDTLAALADVDVFIPNDVEAMNYTRTDDPAAAARALGEYVPLAVVTKGPQGVVAYDSGTGELCEIDTIAVEAVDPTGAGDVFTAAFMSTYALNWPLAARLRLATTCASLSVRSLGGAISAPRPADVLHHFRTTPPAGDRDLLLDWAQARSAVPTVPAEIPGGPRTPTLETTR